MNEKRVRILKELQQEVIDGYDKLAAEILLEFSYFLPVIKKNKHSILNIKDKHRLIILRAGIKNTRKGIIEFARMQKDPQVLQLKKEIADIVTELGGLGDYRFNIESIKYNHNITDLQNTKNKLREDLNQLLERTKEINLIKELTDLHQQILVETENISRLILDNADSIESSHLQKWVESTARIRNLDILKSPNKELLYTEMKRILEKYNIKK